MGIIEKMRLDGKKTFVTGGARGIGKAIAFGLAEAGADVAIVDIDIDEAKKTAEEISRLGVKAISIQTDVTDEAMVNAMTQTIVSELGGIDAAFLNAGICMNIKAEEMTLSQWQKVIDVNLTSVFLTAQAAGKEMIKAGKGSIIATASISGHIVNTPQPQCSYNASKAGVIQLIKSLAVEWAKYNVRVNCISPGYIATELISSSDFLKPLIQEWNAMSPVHRMGKPEELQALAVYLAGDTSSFVTGSDIIIDGAFTCV